MFSIIGTGRQVSHAKLSALSSALQKHYKQLKMYKSGGSVFRCSCFFSFFYLLCSCCYLLPRVRRGSSVICAQRKFRGRVWGRGGKGGPMDPSAALLHATPLCANPMFFLSLVTRWCVVVFFKNIFWICLLLPILCQLWLQSISCCKQLQTDRCTYFRPIRSFDPDLNMFECSPVVCFVARCRLPRELELEGMVVGLKLLILHGEWSILVHCMK